MKKIPVKQITDGSKLSRDVIYTDGDLLIKEGTILKEVYIPLLEQLSIDSVYIEDDNFNVTEFLISARNQIADLKNIIEQYIYNEESNLKPIQKVCDDVIGNLNANEFDLAILNEELSLYSHSVQVAYLCGKLSQAINLTESDMKDLVMASLLHDIGLRYITTPFIGIDFDEMTPAQVFEFKKHTIYGYTALSKVSWLNEDTLKMILSHHERIDGSGYPLRQRDQDIKCRIIQAVDAYVCGLTGMETVRKESNNIRNSILDYIGGGFDKTVVTKLFEIIDCK